jgi:hypothetical protein
MIMDDRYTDDRTLDHLARLFLTESASARADGPAIPPPSHATPADLDAPTLRQRPVRLAPKPAQPARLTPQLSPNPTPPHVTPQHASHPLPRLTRTDFAAQAAALDDELSDAAVSAFNLTPHRAAAATPAGSEAAILAAPQNPTEAASPVAPMKPVIPAIGTEWAPASILPRDIPVSRPQPAPTQVTPAPTIVRPPVTVDELPAPSVDTVFMGNLPGFGAPWLTQYAGAMANRIAGAVALLRVDDEAIEVQIVRPRRISPAGDDAQPLSSRPELPDDSLNSLLESLVMDASLNVRAFVVHIGSPANPAIVRRASELPGRWTLLCGADEAALASGRLILAQLQAAAPALDGSPRRSGVMIVGSEPLKAAAAAASLRNALPEGTVEFVGAQKQMQPIDVQDAGTFEGRSLWSQARSFLVEFDMAASDGVLDGDDDVLATPDAAAASPVAPAPFVAAAAQPTVAEPRVTAPIAPIAPTPAPVFAAAVAASSAPVQPVASAAPVAAPVTIDDAESPDLSQFLLNIPGKSLEARCPRQPRVQLLLTSEGKLHLLAYQSPSQELRIVTADLLEARSWVREHLSLLMLTERSQRFDSAAEPALHLFSGDSRKAAAAVAGLGTTIDLHLLQRVTVSGQSAWFAAALT